MRLDPALSIIAAYLSLLANELPWYPCSPRYDYTYSLGNTKSKPLARVLPLHCSTTPAKGERITATWTNLFLSPVRMERGLLPVIRALSPTPLVASV